MVAHVSVIAILQAIRMLGEGQVLNVRGLRHASLALPPWTCLQEGLGLPSFCRSSLVLVASTVLCRIAFHEVRHAACGETATAWRSENVQTCASIL